MKKKSLFLALVICMLAFFVSGCTSPTGQTLSSALSKMTNCNTYDCVSDVNLKVKLNNFPSDEYDMTSEFIEKFLSDVNLKVEQSIDEDNQKAKVFAALKYSGLSMEMEGYLNGDKMWLKLPTISPYLEYDMAKSNGFKSAQKYLNYQKQSSLLTRQFAKEYIKNFKFNLNNIKDKGRLTIDTPEGKKEVNEIEVILDNFQVRDLIKYGVLNLFGDKNFEDYAIKMLKLADEDGTNVDSEFISYIHESLESFKQEMRQGINEGLAGLNADIVLNYFIDKEGNIIRDQINFKTRIVNPEQADNPFIKPEEKQSIDILIDIKNNLSNINKKAVIDYPSFDSSNTVTAEEFLGEGTTGTMGLASVFEDYKEAKRRLRTSTFYIDESYSILRGEYRFLDVYPYSKNGTTYVPARSLAEALGVKLQVKGKTVKFIGDDNKTLVLNLKSNKASLNGKNFVNKFVPEIKNGRTMVPLRLVATTFGAKIEVMPQYGYYINMQINVEAQK